MENSEDLDFAFNMMSQMNTNTKNVENVRYQIPYQPEILQYVEKSFYEDISSKINEIKIANDRYFLLHQPFSILSDTKNTYPVLFFFHGLGSWAWECALLNTNWREIANKNNFFVVFAAGTDCGSFLDKRKGFNVKNPTEDFQYIQNILKELEKYNIDKKRIYSVGHSNGSIFSSHIAQHFGNKVFAAMASTMGGFGKMCKEVWEYKGVNPLPFLIITGENDDYKESCIYAKNYFEKKGYETYLNILKGYGHKYPKEKEEEIWNFLLKYQKTN